MMKLLNKTKELILPNINTTRLVCLWENVKNVVKGILTLINGSYIKAVRVVVKKFYHLIKRKYGRYTHFISRQ